MLFLWVFATVFTVGCGKSQDAGEIIAKVGNETVTVSDFNERISHLPPRYQEAIKKRKNEFLQEIINDMLLHQEAVRRGLDKDKDVQKIIEAAKVKIVIARYLKDNVDDTIVLTNEEIETVYRTNASAYMTPEMIRASHILVPSRERAEAIKNELETGVPFDELARAKSIDPTAQDGGDIGYFPKGQLMPEFEEACAVLEVGEVSGPVKTKLGYHLIKITDRKEPQLRPLDEVRKDIISEQYKRKRREKFNSLLKRLNDKTEIVINEEALEKAGN